MRARIGYLSSGAEERAPHRKVTLVFDGDQQDQTQMRELLQQIVADFSLLHIRPLLQEEPRVVRPADRRRECRECGSLARPHQCPFTDTAAGTLARLRLQPAASRSATH